MHSTKQILSLSLPLSLSLSVHEAREREHGGRCPIKCSVCYYGITDIECPFGTCGASTCLLFLSISPSLSLSLSLSAFCRSL